MSQVDAPQDPDAFVHRVGRSARMGRPGRGLILLTPSEQPYVKFLLVRKVSHLCLQYALMFSEQPHVKLFLFSRVPHAGLYLPTIALFGTPQAFRC